MEGKQVTLTVKVAGSPTPTITWLFNGKKVEDDYSTEVGKDGSLTLVCVELKHAGTYTFSVSNSVGSVEGCTKLVVHTEDEERTSAPKIDSNPVAKETFGEYVSSLHAHSNAAYIAQYQVINPIAPPHYTPVGIFDNPITQVDILSQMLDFQKSTNHHRTIEYLMTRVRHFF